MSKRSKACDISSKVKRSVWERDEGCCIICGSPYAMPNMHYIRRSQGGLGIEENVVTGCQKCHDAYDNGNMLHEYGDRIKNYLSGKYEDWNEEKLIYDKWKR